MGCHFFNLIGWVVVQAMEEEDLEDAACILDHLLVEGIRIVSSRLEFVRWLTLREDNENVEGLDVGVFKAYKSW